MKHIPGTTFVVGQPVKKTGGSLLQAQTKISQRPIGNFLPKNEYVLAHIRPVDGKFHYYFQNRTVNKPVVEVYSSILEADNSIDRLMGK